MMNISFLFSEITLRKKTLLEMKWIDPETDSIFQNALIISSILISQRRKKQMMSSTYVDVTFEKFNYPLLIQEENILKIRRERSFI